MESKILGKYEINDVISQRIKCKWNDEEDYDDLSANAILFDKNNEIFENKILLFNTNDKIHFEIYYEDLTIPKPKLSNFLFFVILKI